MAEFTERLWTPQFEVSGLSRTQRRSGKYRAYVPDPLSERTFTFDGMVAADIADAERDITRLDTSAATLSNTEALARLLLRAESVASSNIEGLVISPQRLLRADVARLEGVPSTDETACEVIANVDAMAEVVRDRRAPITVERIVEFHRRLLAPTRNAALAGRIRTTQNWIGGTRFAPFGAAFVPPPPDDVPRLLTDLCAFCNDDSLPAVAQAAIAHAQFETIHPFGDGNGRTGRALIHMIFGRRELTTRTLLPVSLILATRADDYIAALQSTRYEGTPDSPQALGSTSAWVGLFSAACSQSALDAQSFEESIEALTSSWRERLGAVRSDSSALALLERLPRSPIVTSKSVERMLGVTFNAANGAIASLVDAGVLVQTRAGRRNRAFEARELLDAFTNFERRLASVDADTRISEPARDVPPRPQR